MNDVSKLCANAASGNCPSLFVFLSAASIFVALLSAAAIEYNPPSYLCALHRLFLCSQLLSGHIIYVLIQIRL
jgi:hypothetical protein